MTQLPETPITLDDTQPHHAVYVNPLSDTQPVRGDTRPLTPVRAAKNDFLVFLLVTAIVSSIIVFAGGGLLYLLLRQPEITPANVTLQIDGRSYALLTAAATVQELLDEQQFVLGENQGVAPALETPLTEGLIVAVYTERSVKVTIDGEMTVFRTVHDHPLAILDSVNVFPQADDEIHVNGVPIEAARLPDYPLPANEITLRRAVTVQIVIDDAPPLSVTTVAATVGEALQRADIPLFLGDVITPSVESPIAAQQTITIDRSRPVTLIVDGVRTETRARGQTVGDALNDAGIVLTGLDYAIPPENTRLNADMQIRVVRVVETVEVEQEPIPYEAIYQADAELELDQKRVIQAGVAGIQQRNIRVRYEDGVEVSRNDEGTSIIQAPQNQITAYGTNIVLRPIETPDGVREYWRVLRVYATSYHPAALGGDNITATGRVLTKGIVGIDPRLIPYSTELYVSGYGVGIAADTGAPRRSRYWIDLGYDDENWVSWSRWVDVYLLTPIPKNYPVLLPAQ